MTVTDASTDVGPGDARPGTHRDLPDPPPEPDELSLDDDAGPAARILAVAATAFDPLAMAGVLKGSIWGMGVVATWNRVVCPVLRALEQLPPHTGQEMAVERLLSRTVFEAFASVPRPEPVVPVRVLLACADGEQHTLALHALSAAAAEAGLPCCSLGADTPPQALRRAVNRIRPAVVVVWSQTVATADPAQLRPLLLEAPRPTVVAAGPGWTTAALQDTVARPDDLADALAAIVVAVEDVTGGHTSISTARSAPHPGARRVRGINGDGAIRWSRDERRE